jgi:hypothetical protein
VTVYRSSASILLLSVLSLSPFRLSVLVFVLALAEKTGAAKNEMVKNSLKGANPKVDNLAEDNSKNFERNIKQKKYDRLFIGSCYGNKANKRKGKNKKCGSVMLPHLFLLTLVSL